MSCFVGADSLQCRNILFPSCNAFNSKFNASPWITGTNTIPFSKILFNNSNVLKTRHARRKNCLKFSIPMAALAVDSDVDLAGKFNLDDNLELQVTVTPASSGNMSIIELEVTNSDDRFVLHWGGIADNTGGWVLPSRRPSGTTVYKNKALRTSFLKSGRNSLLKVEIDDLSIQALEFLIYNETKNRWLKNKNDNFHIELPKGVKQIQSITVPEDLVQIQAYLRWERKGKQMYTPEKEKEEYEAARTELLEEISQGTSIGNIRARLTNKKDEKQTNENFSESRSVIPDDLAQIQAYIRWEKAGKPNYSSAQQLIEFEEAKKELQIELEKGISLDEIRTKIIKGEIQTKDLKKRKGKVYFTPKRIQRKKRGLEPLINKCVPEMLEKLRPEPLALSKLENFARKRQQKDVDTILSSRKFKLVDNELLVILAKSASTTQVCLITDLEEPISLHWALSKNHGEWLAPPSSLLPKGSVLPGNAVETEFVSFFDDDPSYKLQSLEIEVPDDAYAGMPFVIHAGGNWIKNDGSDFYVDFTAAKGRPKDAPGGEGTAKILLDKIADMESEAQKSFMHRFNIAADLLTQAKDSGTLGFTGLLVWMRFMAIRQLVWNKNYNVKPREISKAQDRLTDILQNLYVSSPQYRELLRMIMSTVGRGGEGDVGQRIRDEILVIQRNNDCKGGMMEEWHQKLHNNTSPDDVVICQALIDYIKNNFDISAYWKTLNSNGITKERLLSYDRAIHSEPNFRKDQKDGLLLDLGNYMRTLKAVHSGADLESAISNCMGYQSKGEGFMVGVQVNPVPGLPSGFPELLKFVLEHVEDKSVEALLEGLLEARQELRPLIEASNPRLKDLLFLDIALDSTVRTVAERGYGELSDAGAEKIMYFISLVLENLVLSVDDNEDLVYCLKGWNYAIDMVKAKDKDWALYAKSVIDRNRLALASKAEWYQRILQPSAEYLGLRLGVDSWAVNTFTEEIIRAGSAASLSSLLNRLDPILRQTANLGSWQIISPVEAVGYVVVVDEMLAVQNESYSRPTILVAKRVKGEEEIPDGTVGVLTPDMPDVLSHVSVRARNGKVCFATCFDSEILDAIRAREGKLLHIKPTSSQIAFSETDGETAIEGSNNISIDGPLPSITLFKKKFCGRYAVSAEEFTSEMVGAKSRNISFLKDKVSSWIGIPTSVALPFGVFEKVLSDHANKVVAEKLGTLSRALRGGEFTALQEIRELVLQLVAPPQLVEELRSNMQKLGMPWPGDEGEPRWEQAWMAIKKVWASKWNHRAYFSIKKAKLDHDYICMSVLVQEIINADYAFVIHTTNPSTGNSTEIYAEVVKGLGETLVGAYPGRAMSFICNKSDISSPKVLGYPSKPIGLFIKRSIIFRSDSNGEDLEGYAGAGLYDSVPMDEEEKIILDYSSDRLTTDREFRQSILSGIAHAGKIIEDMYGSPQDIEGVVRNEKIYVVQTRPQM